MQLPNAPGTPAWLGTVNDRAALALVLEHGVVTRNSIHRLTGLSKPTASQIISRLDAGGFIHSIGAVPGRRGPSAAGYAVNLQRHLGVAIDVTATGIHATLVDVAGTDHPVCAMPRTHSVSAARTTAGVGERTSLAYAASADSRGWQDHGAAAAADSESQDEGANAGASIALTEVRNAIQEASRAAGVDPASVGHLLISVPGSVDPRTDTLWGADALEPWPLTGLQSLLHHGLGVAVRLENDVKLATTAEVAARRSEDGCQDLTLLWLGNGLGVGHVVDEEVIRGGRGRAGEIGYLAPTEAALALVPTACDMQDLLGGPSVMRLLESHQVRCPESHADTEDHARLDCALAGLVAADDETRHAVLDALADRIAALANPLLFILDPHHLVLGGPTGAAGGNLLAERVAERIQDAVGWRLDLSSTRVPEQAVLYGARARLTGMLREAILEEVGSEPGAP